MNLLKYATGTNQYRIKYALRTKTYRYGLALSVGFILLLLILSTIKLTNYLDTYEVKIQNFIKIEPRPLVLNRSLFKKAVAKEQTLEEYICTFDWDCQTALAVARAESGMRCDAQNVNRSNSLDAGLFQINSVHLRKGWRIGDLLNCRQNTEYAFEIYQGSGWSAWSVCKNGKVNCI